MKRPSKTAVKPPPKSKKLLPKTFQGADVVRGEGMNADKLDTFVERRAKGTGDLA